MGDTLYIWNVFQCVDPYVLKCLLTRLSVMRRSDHNSSLGQSTGHQPVKNKKKTRTAMFPGYLGELWSFMQAFKKKLHATSLQAFSKIDLARF